MMISNRSLLICGLLLAPISVYFILHQSQRQQAATQGQIEVALARLQSLDESEAANAKAELAAMGEPAVEPLISLLRTLNSEQAKMLATTLGGSDVQKSVREFARGSVIVDPQTKVRVENDIYELLGQLHADAAVPLLVSIMEAEEIDDLIQGMSPVMRSLAAIGSAAVPKLIESVDEAQTTAHTSIERQFAGDPEEVQQRQLGWLKGRIEWRGILVLRAIGDQRALPVLNKVTFTSDNWFIAEQAKEAAEKILAQVKHPQ